GAGRLRERLVVDGQVTLRIAVASVEHAEARPLLDELAGVALGARHAGALGRLPLDVRALRVPAAADERPEPPNPLGQRPAALRTGLVEELGLGALRPVQVADVATLRVAVAADELPVAAELDDQAPGLAALLRTAG